MVSKTDVSDSLFRREIHADRLRLLYEQSVQGVYFSLLSASFLAVILWSHTPTRTLVGWLLTLGVASAVRVTLFLRYRSATPQGLEMLRWGRPYALSLFFSASVWGVGGVLIIPPDSMLHATIIGYFLLGMTGAGMSAYSAVRSFAMTTVVIMLLPMTLWLLSRGEVTPLFMALGAMLLFASALRTSKVLAETLQRNYQLTHALNQSKEAAERLARIDVLTGLNNRRAFNELADAAIRLCHRQAQSVAAIVLDIDHFKQINDSRGHSTGDLALKHLALLIQENVRKTDICARIGGEEFAVLLPDADLDAAATVAEKIRQAVSHQPLQTGDGPLLMTASLGVSSTTADIGLDALLRPADSAMYKAKQAGRNRVVAEPGPQAPAAAPQGVTPGVQ